MVVALLQPGGGGHSTVLRQACDLRGRELQECERACPGRQAPLVAGSAAAARRAGTEPDPKQGPLLKCVRSAARTADMVVR